MQPMPMSPLAAAAAAGQRKQECDQRILDLRQELTNIAMTLRDRGVPAAQVRAAAGAEPRRPVYQIVPNATLQLAADVREQLKQARAARSDAIEALATAVYRAKEAGYSHNQIGKTIGSTWMYAQQLYLRGRDGHWYFQRDRETVS